MYTDRQVESLYEAKQVQDLANFRLFMALDYAVSLSPAMRLTSDVLKALDDAREAAALMWPFFVEPAITAVLKQGKCVTCGEQTADYRDAVAEGIFGMDWCCKSHEQAEPSPSPIYTTEAAGLKDLLDRDTDGEDEPDIMRHAGGAMTFADPQKDMPF